MPNREQWSYVYVFYTDAGRSKVGFSKNPLRRQDELQRACAEKIRTNGAADRELRRAGDAGKV
jgi:hypothetical protein